MTVREIKKIHRIFGGKTLEKGDIQYGKGDMRRWLRGGLSWLVISAGDEL